MCKNRNCDDDWKWDGAIDIVGPYNEGKIEDIDNWISHIRLYPHDPNTEKYVQAFSQAYFGTGHAGIFGIGDYTNED